MTPKQPPTSEKREAVLPRYSIGIREFHSTLGFEYDYSELSIERHPEGDWVKFVEVLASLTEAQAENARLKAVALAALSDWTLFSDSDAELGRITAHRNKLEGAQ